MCAPALSHVHRYTADELMAEYSDPKTGDKQLKKCVECYWKALNVTLHLIEIGGLAKTVRDLPLIAMTQVGCNPCAWHASTCPAEMDCVCK
jgi:hypothetical protein